MKNKLMACLLAALAFSISLPIQAAELFVSSTFGDSEDGTKSATAFVPKAIGPACVTDLQYALDQGVTTGTVDIQRAESETSVNSATSGTGTVLWFDNDPTKVSSAEYVIFWDDSAATYFLYRCVTTAATSITIQETAPITTTSDKIYPCLPTVRRAVTNPKSNTMGTSAIWLPSDLPSALTIDGNTTSCRISVNGVRYGGN